MPKEDERSLQKRPELIPEQLMQGGMIVGVEPSVQESLMSMTGMALERITRERSKVPPEFNLPERPVYFLEPNSRRMIMVSNREPLFGPPSHWREGLFAEVVELDDEGKPRFYLSTKEVIVPTDQYQLVAIGPNEFNMSPSHIPMLEEDDPKNPKFVPWNVYLGSLQRWMNETTIDPKDDFESFMNRFIELRNKSKEAAKKNLRTAFPGGLQGFDETIAPFNLIISDEVHREMYEKASRDAGLFPVFVSARDFIMTEHKNREELGQERFERPEWAYAIGNFLPGSWGSEAKRYHPAVITDDWTAIWRLEDHDKEFTKLVTSPAAIQSQTLGEILRNNPVFSYVTLARNQDRDPEKKGNGTYYCPNNEQMYRQFLYKIKADLLLTMFIRGGAPIVK